MTKKEQFLKSYKSNMGHISDSCEAVKMSRNAYYDWLKSDPKFAQKVAEIDKSFIDLAECALRKNIKAGIQKAVEFALTNLKKEKYSNTQKTELSGPGGAPLTFIIEKSYEKEKQENTPA